MIAQQRGPQFYGYQGVENFKFTDVETLGKDEIGIGHMIYVITEMPPAPGEAAVNDNGRGKGGVVRDHLHTIVER